MKEKIKNFAKEKGWWIIGTGILVFTLSVIYIPVAFGTVIAAAIAQFIILRKP